MAGVGKEAYNTVVLGGGINILVGRVAVAGVVAEGGDGGDASVEDDVDVEADADAKIIGTVPDVDEVPGNISKIILPTSTPPSFPQLRFLHQSPTVGLNDSEAPTCFFASSST